MNISLRIASITGIVTLASSGTAGATAVRLAALTPTTLAASTSICPTPSVPAAVTLADSADLPQIAAGQNVTGITVVRISLDDRGRLVDKAVFASSGNRWIDRAAMDAAASSQYAAEIRNCVRVGGDYGFIVDFTQ